jgi:hypothetical protein
VPGESRHFDGRPFVTKLHFKAAEFDAARREATLCLLAETAPPGTEAAILDARRGELITAKGLDPDLDALLISEAAAFAALLAVGQDNADPPARHHRASPSTGGRLTPPFSPAVPPHRPR